MTAAPSPNLESTLRLDLRLSTSLDDRTRLRCPDVGFLAGDKEIAVYRTDEAAPALDVPDAAFTRVEAGTALSRAIDEEAWLRELGRVLAPDGKLRFMLPASGPLAWLDARNIYRYVTDVTKRGDAPDDSLPTGWNRHYSEKAVRQMLDVTGLRLVTMERSGIGLSEIPQLAGFLACNFVLGDREAERKLHPLRVRMETAESRLPVPGIGTMLFVTATRS